MQQQSVTIKIISIQSSFQCECTVDFKTDNRTRRILTISNVEGRFDLSRWRIAGNGADMIRPDICQAFVDAFASAGFKAGAFTPSYGLAETTLAVSVAPMGQGILCDLIDERRLAGEGFADAPREPSKPVRYRAIVDCGV